MKRITVTVVQLLLSLLVNVEVSHANITRKEPMTMANDFDFEIGSWVVEHRKLKDFFNGKDEWIAFTGISSTRKILGGQGNLEENLIEMPDGTFSAVAIRTYEQKTGLWHIWWLDGRVPGSIDKPVVGKFESGLGTFFAEDVINGHEVKVRFIWDARNSSAPNWQQAFSFDGGKTWKTNWEMVFVPATESSKLADIVVK